MGLYDGVLHFILFCESRCTTKPLPASEEPVLVSTLLTTSSLAATHVVTPRLSSFIPRLSIFECLLEVSNQTFKHLTYCTMLLNQICQYHAAVITLSSRVSIVEIIIHDEVVAQAQGGLSLGKSPDNSGRRQ